MQDERSRYAKDVSRGERSDVNCVLSNNNNKRATNK